MLLAAFALQDEGLFLLGLDAVGDAVLRGAEIGAIAALAGTLGILLVLAALSRQKGRPASRTVQGIAGLAGWALTAGVILGAFLGAAKGLLSPSL